MIRLLLVALAALAALPLMQRPAQAAEPPWCLIGPEGIERCYYDSLDACLRNRGPGSFCNPNPRYQGAQRDRKPAPRQRRRH